jgi:predicted nucleic acid-binding protein
VIAADTSTWIAFFQGAAGRDVELLDRALGDRQVMMAPPVLTELFSDPKMPSHVRALLDELPLLQVADGFWARAGQLRATVLGRQRKARLGDALIAQSCADGGVPLITRDRDFRAFADAAGLELVVEPPG